MQTGPPLDVAKRLRAERERIGMTAVALAEAAGVGRATQANYEAGGTSPDVSYLHCVGQLGIDTLYVLTGTPSTSVIVADQADILWMAAEAARKVAAKFPDVPVSDQAMGEAMLKCYRALLEQNQVIAAGAGAIVAGATKANHE
jgi:transcriptional regulator with XRE-family HTH domain